jgi:hypothetical protein
VVTLAAAGPMAAAQESMWGSGPYPALPPSRSGSAVLEPALPPLGPPLAAPSDAVLEPTPEALPPGEMTNDDAFNGSVLGEPMKMLHAHPLSFESSGTWLRRGYWYGEADFLFLNRGWDRKGMLLASEFEIGRVPEGQLLATNELKIKGERPGGEGNARVKLGRFLFRDSFNRDHLMEIGFYGGGEWMQEGSLQAATAAGLQISDFIDRVNISFDGARNVSFDHGSELHSGELNYLVKQRMHRDQMIMEPSGEWIRKATPSRTYTYLAGVRYVSLREMLGIDATDIPLTTPTRTEDGFYNVHTRNSMIGTQLGAGLAHETARWSVGAMAKAGAYINRIDLESEFQVGEATIANSGVTDSREDDLSFVAEAQLLAKWHLRPNVSLRAGLELLFIDSIALAPHQLNFISGGFEQIAASGDSVFLGTSFGIESHW